MKIDYFKYLFYDATFCANLMVSNKYSAYCKMLTLMLESEGFSIDKIKTLANQFHERENVTCMDLGIGISMPHALISGDRCFAGWFSSRAGFWEGRRDKLPIHLIFILLYPLENEELRISLMVDVIDSLSKNEKVLNTVFQSKNTNDLRSRVKEIIKGNK